MEALGIEPKLLLAQIVNFIIVLLLLRKFLYSPILSMLQSRSEKIATGLKDAEDASESKKNANTMASELLEKAEKEAQSIREDAKFQAKKSHEKILMEANDKAAKVIENAKIEAQNLKDNALTSAKKELSGVMMLAMEKVLGNDLSSDQREVLTKKAIGEL